MSKPTPRPWSVTAVGSVIDPTYWIDASYLHNRGPIAILSQESENIDAPEREANAALIVKAVNLHDELVEALEGLFTTYDHVEMDEVAYEKARSVLARAKGES